MLNALSYLVLLKRLAFSKFLLIYFIYDILMKKGLLLTIAVEAGKGGYLKVLQEITAHAILTFADTLT